MDLFSVRGNVVCPSAVWHVRVGVVLNHPPPSVVVVSLDVMNLVASVVIVS